MIRVYDDTYNVIEKHEHKGDFFKKRLVDQVPYLYALQIRQPSDVVHVAGNGKSG